MTNTVKFHWDFDTNAKRKPKPVMNRFTNTKSLSEAKLSPLKEPPVAFIGTNFSKTHAGRKPKVLGVNRGKDSSSISSGGVVRDSMSYKPYATSSLWKPTQSGPGPGDRSRKTFLTLTPVTSVGSSAVGQGQWQVKPAGVPLISLTPPLRVDPITHQTIVPAAESDVHDISPTGAPRSPSSSGCRFCHDKAARWQDSLDLARHSSPGQEFRDPEEQNRMYPLHPGACNDTQNHWPGDYPEIVDDSDIQKHSEFSKLSKLPAIESLTNRSEKTDSDMSNSENYRSISPELDYSSQLCAHNDGTNFTNSLWENPRLSRGDTLLDSISDRNLLDQKTLFSKKVNASYSRITHENTIILPPVECNRRHRDVLSDSSYLLERKYVNDALTKQPKFRREMRKQKGATDGAMPMKKNLELDIQEPEINNSRRLMNKTSRSKHLGNGQDSRRDTSVHGRKMEDDMGPNTNLDHYGYRLYTKSNGKDDYYERDVKQTRFRLPARYYPHFEDTNLKEPIINYSRSRGQRSLMASQTSQLETPSHMTTHFCDVLGKNSCSRCREQRERRLQGKVTGSVTEKMMIGLARTGIVSPPPVPSPSPTLFLPVQALHKVVIRVKDKQGSMSVASVGYNEDVVRRTTA